MSPPLPLHSRTLNEENHEDHQEARRGGGAVAVLALTLTAACSSGGDPADEPSASSGILDGQRVGAMDDYEVGTTFEATEPVSSACCTATTRTTR